MSRWEKTWTWGVTLLCVAGISYYTGHVQGWRHHQQAKVMETVVMRSKAHPDECYVVRIMDADLTKTPILCPENAPSPLTPQSYE